MNWGEFFKTFLRNLLATLVIAGGVLGVVGYWMGGTEGLVNGFSWGVILTLFSAPFSAFVLISRQYWGDYAGRYSAWKFKKDSEGEPDDPGLAENSNDRWPQSK